MAVKHTWIDGREYVLVQKGDTLGQIAIDFAGGYRHYPRLAAINDIADPDFIVIGQKIFLTESTESSGGSTETSTVVISQLGWQSNPNNTDDTILATWRWSRAGAKRYWVQWDYQTGSDGIWYNVDGHEDLPEDGRKYALCTPPNNATIIRVRVHDRDVGTSSRSPWVAFNLSDKRPAVPPQPSVSIDGAVLTASVTNLDDLAKKIEFEIVKDDTTIYKVSYGNVTTLSASISTVIDIGHKYKVRCRAINDYGTSDWCQYTGNNITVPYDVYNITTCVAASSTSVRLAWDKVSNAESYEIQYATSANAFNSTNLYSTATSTENDTVIGNLTAGNTYYFRVRATNGEGGSNWSKIKSTPIGTVPAAPTTWSSTNVVRRGETVTFYWTHNSEDGSEQRSATLTLIVNGVTDTINLTSETHYVYNTRIHSTDTTITWYVATKGVIDTESPYSTAKTISVLTPAVLDLAVPSFGELAVGALTSFPLRIEGVARPATQTPIGYQLSIISNETYETVDHFGNITTVNENEQIYSKYFDGPGALNADLSAGDVDFENGVGYTINCIVVMDSGLTAEASIPFTVNWEQVLYMPNAEISVDTDTYAAHIKPYCSKTSYVRYKVYKTSNQYVKSSDTIGSVFGDILRNVRTTTGEQVYYGTTGAGEETYYCEVKSTVVAEEVSLAVYRREFDGGFTEIIRGIKNGVDTWITDPHPALDYARYRIVATHDNTGSVSYYDVPGYPVNGKYMVLQWNEAWTPFDVNGDTDVTHPLWSGSTIKLLANIDVSDQYNTDSTLVNYIGRKHPVSYYGTHTGESSSWSAVIQKDDVETVYALRRLAIWMGDVYVREPSGSGYWANVKVSFSKKHNDLTIPVSLSITRVEGGI